MTPKSTLKLQIPTRFDLVGKARNMKYLVRIDLMRNSHEAYKNIKYSFLMQIIFLYGYRTNNVYPIKFYSIHSHLSKSNQLIHSCMYPNIFLQILYFKNRSIWPIHETVPGTTTPTQSGLENNGS